MNKPEFGVDDGVVNRPESVEVKGLFVELGHGNHLCVWLVADDVIDEVQTNSGTGGEKKQITQSTFIKVNTQYSREGREGISLVDVTITWKELSLVVVELHKGVDGISVRLDGGEDDGSVAVAFLQRRSNLSIDSKTSNSSVRTSQGSFTDLAPRSTAFL